METRTITPEQKEALDRRLPDEAVSQHPTKKFLSSIKSIYVTERLNEVFGVGSWRVETEIVERSERMVVVKLRFSIPEYGIYYECFGGNDNADLGDACKGATTDALTKVSSCLGIGDEGVKGRQTGAGAPPQSSVQRLPAAPDPIPAAAAVQAAPKKRITADMLNDPVLRDQIMRWAYKGSTPVKDPTKFDVIAFLRRTYDAAATTAVVFAKFYDEYLNSKQQKI